MSYPLKSSIAVSILALLSTSALAADVYTGSSKDAPAQYAPDSGGMVNWSGFYIGIQGGYGNANHNLTVQEYEDSYDAECTGGTLNAEGDGCALVDGQPVGVFHAPVIGDPTVDLFNLDGINSHGGIAGGRVGYDFARGRVLFGVFGEYNFTNMETTAELVGVGAFDLTKGDEWSAGARVGYIVAPRTLAYILAAYTQTEYTVGGLDIVALGQDENLKTGATFDGISVGAGVEFALASNIFLGMEYVHTFYGEETIIDFSEGSAEDRNKRGVRVIDDLDEDKIMATLKIKLNTDLLGN